MSNYFQIDLREQARRLASKSLSVSVEFKKIRTSVHGLWDEGNYTQAVWALSKVAEDYGTTAQDMAIEIMESLPIDGREEVERFLEDKFFVVSGETIVVQGEEFKPVLGPLRENRFSQREPRTRPGQDRHAGGRGPTQWMRNKDLHTRVWSTSLRHEYPARLMAIGSATGQGALNDSFGYDNEQRNLFDGGEDWDSFPEPIGRVAWHQDEQIVRAILWALIRTDTSVDRQSTRLMERLGEVDEDKSQSQ